MPVSYVSDVIKSNPFIQPFDINLMEKVNSYKQGLFYQNAAKVENMIGQLNNTDIANPQQREYLKGKVNDLTTQLNNIGAVNYSDMGVTNAIESFGSDIYSDPNVINGIASTKSLRQWQANVDKLKTDPKLSKYYNGANEAWDYEHYVKPYVSGGLDATYNGPKAPKPYMGNPFTKAMDIMKTIRPDLETRIDPVTGNQFFFSKTENKAVSSEKIAAALDGLIDGDTKQQLRIDAWYNYDYSTGNKFNKADGLDTYVQDVDNTIRNKQAQITSLNDQISSEPDINKKKQYENYRDKLTDDIKTYNERRTEMVNDFSKDWDKDPDTAKYKLYMKRFYNDVVKAAGYDETKIDLIKNEERLFNARQQLEYTKKGLWWDGQSYNHDGTPLVQPVPGAESMIDKSTKEGKTGKEPIDPAAGIFHDIKVNTENTQQAEQHRVTPQSLLDDNKTIDNEQNKKLKDILAVTAKRGGYDLGFQDSPEANAGASAVISTSPLLEQIQNVGDKTTLTKEDIQYVLGKVVEQDIKGNHPNGAYVVPDSNGGYIGLTKNQVQFFKNVMNNWNAMAVGQQKSSDAPMNISVSDWSNFVNDYQMLDLVKKSNLAYMENIDKQVTVGKSLTSEEQKVYGDYLFVKNGGTGQRAIDYIKNYDANKTGDKLASIFKKIDITDESILSKRRDELYANAGDRLNYYSLYLPDENTLEKALPGITAKMRAHATDETGTDKDLKPEAISRKDDGTFEMTYITHGKKDTPIRGSIPLTADEAIHLGGQLYPNEPLEKLLNYQTSSGPLYTYSPVFEQPVKYSVEREGNDRNTRKYIPYIYTLDKQTGKEEKIPIFALDKQGYQGSANAAEFLVKKYISDNAFKGISMEQFLKAARTIANR